MNKAFFYTISVAICLGTTVLLGNSGRAVRTNDSADAQFTINGAFRDGLFVGRLTAESGGAANPPIGRWSSEVDRASFTAGYQRGYEAVVSKSTARE